MNWIKLTAALLTIAVLNPLCCCLSLSAAEMGPAPANPELPMHACCQATPATDQGAQGHTQQECPHDLEKNSQISETPAAFDTQTKPLLLESPLLSWVIESPVLAPRASLDRHPTLVPCERPPSGERTTDHCVYLL